VRQTPRGPAGDSGRYEHKLIQEIPSFCNCSG
jgi:hypothetical protein